MKTHQFVFAYVLFGCVRYTRSYSYLPSWGCEDGPSCSEGWVCSWGKCVKRRECSKQASQITKITYFLDCPFGVCSNDCPSGQRCIVNNYEKQTGYCVYRPIDGAWMPKVPFPKAFALGGDASALKMDFQSIKLDGNRIMPNHFPNTNQGPSIPNCYSDGCRGLINPIINPIKLDGNRFPPKNPVNPIKLDGNRFPPTDPFADIVKCNSDGCRTLTPGLSSYSSDELQKQASETGFAIDTQEMTPNSLGGATNSDSEKVFSPVGVGFLAFGISLTVIVVIAVAVFVGILVVRTRKRTSTNIPENSTITATHPEVRTFEV